MKSITLLWRSVRAGYETVPSGVLSSNFENAFKMCKRERTNSKLFIFLVILVAGRSYAAIENQSLQN